jgi:hypothetical protein
LEEAVAAIKAEEDLIGHPLGSGLKKGRRPLLANESEEFPR